jgi:fatty-acyl-CoA synthase
VSDIHTGWLTSPHPDRGVHLADETGGWTYAGYPELAATARRMTAQLVAVGVRPGDAVCVLMPTGYSVITVLYGVWAAGAAICPVVPPSFQSEDEYVAHVAAILEQAQPALVVTTTELAPVAVRAMTKAGRTDAPLVPRDDTTEELKPQPRGEIALLQFTSGSTGRPRGVRVTWDNLAANLRIIARMTGWRDGDSMASWLPLYHDMGLIGLFLFPLCHQGNLWLMRPDQFIRDPMRWLACFGPGKATTSASPSFAFAYATRRVRPERIEGLDLSGWKCVCIGAETTDVAALAGFARFAASTGFQPTTYQPSYGLAESTLAATSPPPQDLPVVVRPDWAKLRFGEQVQVTDKGRLGEVDTPPGSGWMIGHGRPHPTDDLTIRLLDHDGNELPDGFLGEIAVRGTSVADGYHAGREGVSSRFVDGELRTGDAGFVYEGQLYVLGRMGESIKLRGRNVYVEDLDVKVAAAAGLERANVVVVSALDQGRPGLVVFAEKAPAGWAESVVALLRSEFGPDPFITVVNGRRGLIRRTSSGKPRRRRMWELLQSDALSRATVDHY